MLNFGSLCDFLQVGVVTGACRRKLRCGVEADTRVSDGGMELREHVGAHVTGKCNDEQILGGRVFVATECQMGALTRLMKLFSR